MLFPTVDFAVFFVIVFTGSWMLRPYARAWRWFLLIASCVFYLDPFNPVASEGQQLMTFNGVVLLATAAAGAATAGLLRAGFGPLASQVRGAGIERAHSDMAVEAEAGERGDRSEGSSGGTDVLTAVRRPAAVPFASFWVPAAVFVMLLVGNLVVSSAFPDRISQGSRFLFLLLGVAFLNQAFAQGVFAALGPNGERTSASRWLVRITIIVDLAVLGYFKYWNWFWDAPIFGSIGRAIGIDVPWDIILPIAISFFTFQAISYVIDVGRGELRPIPLLDFTVYLTFFAHVVAGPIVRVKEFGPQLDARSDPRFVPAAEAFELIFRGLFKKVVISSYLSSQIVDQVFASPGSFSRVEVLFAILGYAVQIYTDFSGYTDIAIGVALLLGIRFPQNFDAPYRALSLQDFWRRWHMTLSRWLRDYLYIPLGGNRVSYVRTYVNLFLTMVIGGLWHGANWTFIVWGIIHGGGLAVERLVKERWAERGPLGLPVPVVKVLQWAVTFLVVCLAWVFFRATDFGNAFAILGQLFTGQGTVGAVSRVTPVLVGVVVIMIASQFVPPHIPQRVTVLFARTPPAFQVACAAMGLVLINVLGPEGIAPFIYFQF